MDGREKRQISERRWHDAEKDREGGWGGVKEHHSSVLEKGDPRHSKDKCFAIIYSAITVILQISVR